MCGRYTQTASPAVIAAHFALDVPPDLTPMYNIAPSQRVAAVRLSAASARREWVWLRWGLIPSWAKDAKIGTQCINAKSETVAEKPAFRAAFRQRRCLVIADGFYEWQRIGTCKCPIWIGRRDRQPFAFAGLWEHWQPADGEPLETCTILTTAPNELMVPIHNRMPVILPPAAYEPWLDRSTPVDALTAWLRPAPSEDLQAYPVSTLVNNPRHNTPACKMPTV